MWRCVWFSLSVLGLTGCETVHFYAQAIGGELEILSKRRPVAQLLKEPETPDWLKSQFELVLELRGFAAADLKLPVDGHYEQYADLHRPFVVWSVFAAPEFSLDPKTWWYPIVGRLEYRSYFSERKAAAFRRRMKDDGWDVSVQGVEAYSTLGWFKDPLLNTFIRDPEPELAETLFHELAHQRLFIGSDTDFNEAFATAVGEEGVRRWLGLKGKTELFREYEEILRREAEFVALVMKARGRLQALYDRYAGMPDKISEREEERAEKERILEQLRADYRRLKTGWGGFYGYDAWFAQPFNNALLNTVATYYELVPGFEGLLRQCGGDFSRFYRIVARLEGVSKKQRRAWLRQFETATSRR